MICVGTAGCGRPAASSLLPLLELGFSAQRSRASDDAETSGRKQQWGGVAFVALRFEPRTAAQQFPPRSELAPEAWLLPCDADDVICLQETLEAEAELTRVFGDLQ